MTRFGFNLKPALRQTSVDDDAATEASAGEVDVLFFRNHKGYTRIARMSIGDDGEVGDVEIVVEGERSPRFESLHPLDSKMAISADGGLLAFSSQHVGRDHLFIWDLEAGGELRQLTFDEVVAINSPSWSPDGERLVFSGADKGGITDLYTVAPATGKLRRLTHDIYHDRDPDWSPDGTPHRLQLRPLVRWAPRALQPLHLRSGAAAGTSADQGQPRRHPARLVAGRQAAGLRV